MYGNLSHSHLLTQLMDVAREPLGYSLIRLEELEILTADAPACGAGEVPVLYHEFHPRCCEVQIADRTSVPAVHRLAFATAVAHRAEAAVGDDANLGELAVA